MQDLISIIVPIYNVEKYLNRCIESIIKQTYRRLEIILIDDGSTDNCLNICDVWEKRDDRIRVIHKSHEGVSSARNMGLAISKGEYIAFVDSDDWVHPNYIEYLYIAIKKYKVDLAACDIRWICNDAQIKENNDLSFEEFNKKDALKTLIKGEKFRAVVWNKLYHKSLLLGEKFRIGYYREDEFFTYRIISKTNNLVFVNQKLYYYFQRNGSIMNSVSYKHLDVLEAYLERIAYLKNEFEELYRIDKINFCLTCVYLYIESFKLSTEEKEYCQNKIKNYRKKISFSHSELKHCSLKERAYIIGSDNLIGLFCSLLRIRNGHK